MAEAQGIPRKKVKRVDCEPQELKDRREAAKKAAAQPPPRQVVVEPQTSKEDVAEGK